MKKSIAIVITLIFSATVLLSGALGYSDCAIRCAHEMAKARQHAAMGSMGLAAPNCCSGTMKNACEMAGTPEIKIPECSMPSQSTVTSNPTGVGFISVNIETDITRLTQAGRQFNSDHINKTPPIYLQILSILC